MDAKKAVLKRTFKQIRELFADAEKLETAVESISSNEELDRISLTENVIIKSLVSKLSDVNDDLKSIFTERMERKRRKVLTQVHKKLKRDRRTTLEKDLGNSSDEHNYKSRKKLRKSSDFCLVDKDNESEENNSSKGSIENNNPNSDNGSSIKNSVKKKSKGKETKKNDDQTDDEFNKNDNGQDERRIVNKRSNNEELKSSEDESANKKSSKGINAEDSSKKIKEHNSKSKKGNVNLSSENEHNRINKSESKTKKRRVKNSSEDEDTIKDTRKDKTTKKKKKLKNVDTSSSEGEEVIEDISKNKTVRNRGKKKKNTIQNSDKSSEDEEEAIEDNTENKKVGQQMKRIVNSDKASCLKSLDKSEGKKDNNEDTNKESWKVGMSDKNTVESPSAIDEENEVIQEELKKKKPVETVKDSKTSKKKKKTARSTDVSSEDEQTNAEILNDADKDREQISKMMNTKDKEVKIDYNRNESSLDNEETIEEELTKAKPAETVKDSKRSKKKKRTARSTDVSSEDEHTNAKILKDADKDGEKTLEMNKAKDKEAKIDDNRNESSLDNEETIKEELTKAKPAETVKDSKRSKKKKKTVRSTNVSSEDEQTNVEIPKDADKDREKTSKMKKTIDKEVTIDDNRNEKDSDETFKNSEDGDEAKETHFKALELNRKFNTFDNSDESSIYLQDTEEILNTLPSKETRSEISEKEKIVDHSDVDSLEKEKDDEEIIKKINAEDEARHIEIELERLFDQNSTKDVGLEKMDDKMETEVANASDMNDSQETILLHYQDEEKEKTVFTEDSSQFQVPNVTLKDLINSFLSNQVMSNEADNSKENVNDDSVVIIEDEPSSSKKVESLVGKIKLVAIGKLIQPKEETVESAKTNDKTVNIKVAEFARLKNPIANEIKNLNKEERTKLRKSGERLRNPFAKKLSGELLKLKEQRDKKLQRKSERIKEEEEEEDSDLLNSKRKSRKKTRDDSIKKKSKNKKHRTNHQYDNSETEQERKRHKYRIPNNVPISIVSNMSDDLSSEQMNYSVAKPEELTDKKLSSGCFVRMLTSRTPEVLQQEYKDRPKDVRMDDDGSDHSNNSPSAMVSGAAKGSKRTLAPRTCNSKPTSSNNSSRNSSLNSRGAPTRSTRNSKPVVVKDTSSSNDEERDVSELSSDDEALVVAQGNKEKNAMRGRGRPKKNEGSEKSSRKNGQGREKVGRKTREGEDSDVDEEDSDDDGAASHVSISSSSEPETRKSSKKKIVPKIEKTKGRSRDSYESGEDSDDSVPLTKLPDKKAKIKDELDDSDDSEPAKKKDKKTHKSSESENSDSADSVGRKRKTTKNRRGKKKRVVSDSGSDNYKDDEEDEDEIESVKSSASEEKEKQHKRKRIRRANNDSSDDSDLPKVKKEKKKKGEPVDTRKHIRSIMHKGALNQSTIDAEQEEQDRKKRISEKQKKYNDIYNTNELESTKMDKVVLDIDEETNEEILSVHKSIVKNLKPHQANGIQFMWNACFESVSMIDGKGSGCILAHCMGLGKTLQVIALIHTLITNSDTTKTEKALVVCPLSTVLNWVSEFRKWLKSDIEFEIYELVSSKQVIERQHKIADWHENGGVMIMGYDMFRNLSNPDNKRISKKARTTFVTGLVDPGPDLVICDEGHLLKNEKTSISLAMNRIRTLRRIVLTGTPLQNNLKEYFCMVQFVKPNLLGTYKEYLNRFVNPITNGQYTDSTPHDIQIMRKRSHVLHKLLDGIVQRRDYAVLAPYLPPKHEYVIFVTLTQKQIALYDHYLRVIAPLQRTAASKGVSLFKDFQEFQRICTHPRVLLDKSVQDQMAKWKVQEENESDGTEGSLKDFIDDDNDEEESTASESSKSSCSSAEDNDDPRRGRSKPKSQNTRTTRAIAAEKGIDVVASTSTLEVASTGSEWWREFTTDEHLDDLLCSSKLSLLFEILHQCELIGDKVLIFSQSLYSLSIIEYFLSKIDDAAQNDNSSGVGGYSGSWSLGLDYFRLDGTSSCDNRAAWCKTFNNPKNVRARLFLISTRAGGLGINLVAANRVIIFDVSWNPSHDIQSIYRVYRFGQVKPSYIYRFVSNGAMEMKVYERQVTKQAISKRVIDEQQIDRHYNQNDLAELYKFEPILEHRPIPPVPKDVLLGELVQDKPELIYKYHEHHTLLENKQDEELNEEERKAAWEEFENEKKMRQLPAHINNIPIHSVMLGLTNYLKREHPDWSAAEIQTIVPGLVQEMQEKMALGDVTLYNSMIIELRKLQEQQQQLQQQRMQDYYRLQQQNQERMLLERHRQLMQNNATVSYLQRLYANATAAGTFTPATLNALNALGNNLTNPQLNANPPAIETVDIND